MTIVRSGPGLKDVDKVYPLPELSQENIERCILEAKCNGDETTDKVFETPLYHGDDETCGVLIGHAVATFGLEDPTLAELKAAAREYLQVLSRNSTAA